MEEIDQIVISTGNTEINVKTGLNICRAIQNKGLPCRPDIVVCLHDAYPNAHILNLETGYDNLRFIDINESIYNYSYLIDQELDKTAREQHEAYNQRNNGTGKAWADLTVFTQNSNRAVAMDNRTKERMCERIKNRQDAEKAAGLLAQYEHNRWMAFHYAHGWLTLPVSELTEEEKASNKSKREPVKKHVCLVGWDELDRLPLTKGFKQYDIDIAEKFLQNHIDRSKAG
jgi:hypothetical protein